MNQIATILHGPYAYLLIFQILLVAVLTLIALSLFVRRIKAAAAGVHDFSGISEVEVATLKSSVLALQTERDSVMKVMAELSAKAASNEGDKDGGAKMEALRQSNKSLNDKIKFLESKLLEYEILQEEIGNLSSLKVENERMRLEIVDLQRDIQKSKAIEPTAPIVSPAVVEQRAETQQDIDNLLSAIENLK